MRAAVDGWTEVLGSPDEHECDVDLTTVVHATAESFERACRVKPGPGGAAACLLYESVGLKRSAPRIYLRPGLTDAEAADAVIRESLHNLVECELRRSPWDPFDALHTDKRVWQSAGGVTSAQSKAREAL